MNEKVHKDTEGSILNRVMQRIGIRRSGRQAETSPAVDEEDSEKKFIMRRKSLSIAEHQILSGECQNIDKDALECAGIRPAEFGYYIAVIHIRSNSACMAQPELDHDMTCFTFESVIEDLSKGNLAAAATYMDGNCYCSVISQMVPDISEIYLHDLFEQITELFENEYSQQMYVALSHNSDCAEQIPDACHEAFLLYDFIRTIDSDKSVVILSDIRSDPRSMLKGDFIKQIQVLNSAILLEKYELIPSLVSTILNEHVNELKGHFGIASSRLKTVSGILIEAVLSLELNDTFETDAISKLLHAEAVPDLIAVTDETFTAIVNCIHSSDGKDAVSVSCRFISENLSDCNLGVPEISAAAGVSAQYLSRIFKKKMGISIVEYVNRCRMDCAKRLLSENDDTVQMIAEQTGYNNTVTFTRNFKRYIGMTPTEYRSLNRVSK